MTDTRSDDRRKQAEKNLREIEEKIDRYTTPQKPKQKRRTERWTDSSELEQKPILTREEFVDILGRVSRPLDSMPNDQSDSERNGTSD